MRRTRKDAIHIEITNKYLAQLFSVSERTIRRWIKEEKLIPTSFINIVEQYTRRITQ